MDKMVVWPIITTIFLMILCSTNIILSFIQLTSKKGYVYDGILSMLDENQILLGTNKNKCADYISDIEYKKEFSKIKTIITLVYNSGSLIYFIIRIKDLTGESNCLIDIFFLIIMHIGLFGELVLVSMSLSYYNKTDYDSVNLEKCIRSNNTFLIRKEIFEKAITLSKWVINIDKGIISVTCLYFIPFYILSSLILITIRFDEHKCINKKLCWICSYISEYLCAFCDCFSKCCGNMCHCFADCLESMCNCFSKCCGNMCHSFADCLKSMCNCFSKCCGNMCHCFADCLESMCNCFSKCCGNMGNCLSDCFSFCCRNCGKCCANCCGNNYDTLKKENDNLRKRVKELEKENDILKRQNTDEISISLEKKILQDNTTIIKDNNIGNYDKENVNLINRINDYQNKLAELKEDNNNLTEEIKILQEGVHYNIEEKQMKVIEFYLRKEKAKEFSNYKSILNIFLLKEINEKFGLYLDSENFKKIALYYIKSKLTEHLTDPKNLKLLSDPVIQNDGVTLERANINQTKDFVQNKLVLKIIEILKKNKDLQMEDLIIIKKLLKKENTNNFYNNPVVISYGNNKGETIEGDNLDNKNYKNIVIKNIINELKEFEDDFFKFKGLEIEDMKRMVDYNNIMVINFVSDDGMINQGIKCLKTELFAEVEEKLYKIYDKCRNTNNVFLHGGNIVLRFKTIEENNIKDADKILLQKFEE